jgi:crotonobetainyl-CoA:carnitine CoA-transferase CaiB-like acyl-CoA transferase
MPVIDYATGMSAAFAISSALLQRERTGRGQHIDLSMLDVGLTLMGLHVTGHSYNGQTPRPSGNRGPFPTVGCYETKDGLLMLGASNHRQQRRLWEALDRPDMIKTREEVLTADKRAEEELLTTLLRTRTADEWESHLQGHHVPAARVRSMQESLTDPQLGHRRAFAHIDACAGVDRAFDVPLAPFTFAHDGPSIETAPCKAGADTTAILRELGYDEKAIATLQRDGAA